MHHDLLATIGQELNKGKDPTTSRSESSSTQKGMLNKLYKSSERIAETKLFEQFNKLLDHFTTNMDEDTKRPTK